MFKYMYNKKVAEMKFFSQRAEFNAIRSVTVRYNKPQQLSNHPLGASVPYDASTSYLTVTKI